MNTLTIHELVPTTDPVIAASRETCAAEGHPHGCYSPWMAVTFCRCGARTTAGDHSPALPEPVLCDHYEPCTINAYCRHCYHDRDEHADVEEIGAALEQIALFAAGVPA